MTRSAHQLGLRGERVVAGLAAGRGWQLQAQRLRTEEGEADLYLTRPLARAAHQGGSDNWAEGRAGLVIEVKAAEEAWPSVELVPAHRQRRLWRVAGLLAERDALAEVSVVVALVRLSRHREQVRWIALEAW